MFLLIHVITPNCTVDLPFNPDGKIEEEIRLIISIIGAEKAKSKSVTLKVLYNYHKSTYT